MSLDLSPYLERRWPRDANCWHLVQEVWLAATGTDLGDRTPVTMTKEALMMRFADDVPAFVRHDGPRDPSIVLMRAKGRVPHVGVFIAGAVLQLRGRHAMHTRIDEARIGFDDIGFYECPA